MNYQCDNFQLTFVIEKKTNTVKNISIKNLDNDIIYFTVPTRFIRDWITSHYLDKIIYFLNQENPDIKRVKISIDNALTSNMLKLNKDISIKSESVTEISQ
mgnify:CR=1 FL=1